MAFQTIPSIGKTPMTPEQTEKMFVSAILNHIGHLLIAKSPLQSKAKADAERYRGELLSSLKPEERQMFIQSRDIIVKLANLLARCQDRVAIGHALSYIQSLSQGEVMVAENEPNEDVMRRKLADHLEYLYGYQTKSHELDQIINIVRHLDHA